MLKQSLLLPALILSLHAGASQSQKNELAEKLIHATAVLEMIKASVPGLNSKCIDKAWRQRSPELNQAYQDEYSGEELQQLNQVFLTQAGKHYVADMLNKVRLNKGLPVMQTVNFNEQEQQLVRDFFETPTGKKFSSGSSAQRMQSVGMQVGFGISVDCFKK